MSQLFGKYRGRVAANRDPRGLGRVEVSVPGIYPPGTSSWAMPCVPYAGQGVGLFAIPPVDAHVWVEFEGGDPNHPIWSGCYWETGEPPARPAAPDTTVLKTSTATVTIDSTGVTFETNAGQRVKLGDSGVEITNGQGATIRLAGSQVSVNDGALEVT